MPGTGRTTVVGLGRLASILSLMALAAIAPRPSAGQAPPLTAEALVGTWRLVSVEERRPTGEINHWLGPRPQGLLVYDRTGAVSVQIMRDPSIAATPENQRDAYVAYFGRYAVRDGAVVHQVQGSMRATEIGAEYSRAVRLTGDRLVLALSPTRTVTWQRLK